MNRTDLVLEDTVKRLHRTNKADQFLLEFLETYTPKNKRAKKIGKRAAVNNYLTGILFAFLESYHLPTYFLKKASANTSLVKVVRPISLLVQVRNFSAGNFVKRFRIAHGTKLPYPVVEHYYKNDKLKNPFINEFQAYALGCVTPDEMRMINRMTSKVNAVLKSFFQRRNLTLIDFIIEFGRMKGRIILVGDLSLDGLRLVHNETDTEYFGPDICENKRSPETIYKAVANLIGN